MENANGTSGLGLDHAGGSAEHEHGYGVLGARTDICTQMLIG